MTRRTLLLAPSLLFAQSPRPRLAIQWISGRIPDAFAREAVVFSRAYTCCPNRARAVWAVEHGRFPHAAGDDGPSVWDSFTRSSADAADVVVMTAHSADGKESWRERSVHVPLAIRWRGRLAARVEHGLYSHADVLPLLLRAGAAAAPAEAVYIEGNLGDRGEWRALVRGYDKVVWGYAGGREDLTGLYNVAEDPEEAHDLRAVPAHRLTRDSMWALAQRWMERLEDGRDAHGLRTRPVREDSKQN
jgi:arylsulfatase A-like enzyme